MRCGWDRRASRWTRARPAVPRSRRARGRSWAWPSLASLGWRLRCHGRPALTSREMRQIVAPMSRASYSATALVGLAAVLAAWPVTRPSAQHAPRAAVQIDSDDIGGVVTSKHGPEAGVWVIAETTELGTRFARMVVTDDQGRYVIPDLPQATYSVWVRGYGLVDSPKVKTARGQVVTLTAVLAPSAAEAAPYYPAIYWFSMLKITDK